MRSEISSGGIVFKKDNNQLMVLLIKHAATKYWGFPKGLVGDFDKEESLETAALREVEEEGGVKAKIIAPLSQPTHYQTSWRGQPVTKTVHYFVMQYLSGKTDDHDKEVSEAKFTTIEKAQQTLTYDNDRQNLKEAVTLFKI